jgi:hypothetical protein
METTLLDAGTNGWTSTRIRQPTRVQMAGLPQGNLNHSWSWIWKLQLYEKIKFFFWLTCHNSVPTSQFHVHAVLFQDIKELSSHNNVMIRHTLRERNQSVNYIAKLDASSFTILSSNRHFLASPKRYNCNFFSFVNSPCSYAFVCFRFC